MPLQAFRIMGVSAESVVIHVIFNDPLAKTRKTYTARGAELRKDVAWNGSFHKAYVEGKNESE